MVRMFAIASLILLAVSCTSNQRLPIDARQALEEHLASLPGGTSATRILKAWPGEPSTGELEYDGEIWCVEVEHAATNSVDSFVMTWLAFRPDAQAGWNTAMQATMSSMWPYEACGEFDLNGGPG